MNASQFLEQLEKVKRTGAGRWIARCPAHDDVSPSLLVSERDDGSIGIHCFASCAPAEIVDAVGLTLADLFPDNSQEHRKSLRRPFPASDILEAIESDVFYVQVVAMMMANNYMLVQGDRDRLLLASERIMVARRMANG